MAWEKIESRRRVEAVPAARFTRTGTLCLRATLVTAYDLDSYKGFDLFRNGDVLAMAFYREARGRRMLQGKQKVLSVSWYDGPAATVVPKAGPVAGLEADLVLQFAIPVGGRDA